MKSITLFVLDGLLVMTAVGCDPEGGFGEDLKTAGHWFTRGVDKVE